MNSQMPTPADNLATPAASDRRKLVTARRIVVIDDHPIIRHGIITLINDEPDLEVCGECATRATGLDVVRSTKPDAVVVDLALPDGDGLELIRMLSAERPEMPILVVSMYEESQYALRSLRAGARGYIMKGEAASQVVGGLRKILGGDISMSPRMNSQLIFRVVQALARGEPSAVDQLTTREREILRKFGHGRSTKEIATELDLSPKTIEAHREHIKRKLDLGGAAELVRFAQEWVEYDGK